MSGHNPHSRMGQTPNSTWNHLQVPSYIPRQPQLAHMSNERPLARSPSTWHTPTHPEAALYNFIQSNHKNALDVNSLSMSGQFNRGGPPFTSVDLTLQTAARNSLTPSPRSLQQSLGGNGSSSSSTSVPMNNSQTPQDFYLNAQGNKNNLRTSPNTSVIQTTASIKEKFQNNGELSLVGNNINNSSNNCGGLYIRDAKQINNDIVKLSRDNVRKSQMSEPVELVKEAIYHSMKSHSIPISPQRKSPAPRPPSVPNQSPNSNSRSRSPSITKLNELRPSPSPSPLSATSSSSSAAIALATAALLNNHLINASTTGGLLTPISTSLLSTTLNSLSTSILPVPASSNFNNINSVSQHSNTIAQDGLLVASPTNTVTSNEESSIDLNITNKKRRKRKPNKTLRVSSNHNNNIDDNHEIIAQANKLIDNNDYNASKNENDSNVNSNLILKNNANNINCGNSIVSNNNNNNNNSVSSNSNKSLSKNCDLNNITNDINSSSKEDIGEEKTNLNTEKSSTMIISSVAPIIESSTVIPINNLSNNNNHNKPSDNNNQSKTSSTTTSSNVFNNSNTEINENNCKLNDKEIKPHTISDKKIKNLSDDEQLPSDISINNNCKTIIESVIAHPVITTTITTKQVETNPTIITSTTNNDISSTTISNVIIETKTISPIINTIDNNNVDIIKDEIINDNDDASIIKINQRKRGRSKKNDSDDCETIDKIAAMIASTTPPIDIDKSNIIKQLKDDNTIIKLSEELENNIHDNTDIINENTDNKDLIVKLCKDQPSDYMNANDNSFEEVENKLEEMFAGIEDNTSLEKLRSTCENLTTNSIVDAADTVVKEMLTDNLLENNDNNNDDVKLNIFGNNQGIKRPIGVQNEMRLIKKKRTQINKKVGKNSKNNRKTITKQNKYQINTNNSNANSHNSNNNNTNNNNCNTKEKIKQKDDSLTYDANGTILKHRGPFIHIRNDGQMNVVNQSIAELDDPEKIINKIKLKKPVIHTTNDLNKIRGLHVSTLSIKYDADTTDKSWMCVFCKMGPHKFGLGDLFGPYLITTTCDDFQLSQIEPDNDIFKSKRSRQTMVQKNQYCLPVAVSNRVNKNLIAPTTSHNVKKKKKLEQQMNTSMDITANMSSTYDDIYSGMTKASPDSYEVWLHEDCAVWASGVHIVGVRVIGLETAVWSSVRHKCGVCSNYGAMLPCLQRGCKHEVHVPCARKANWTLNNEEFKSWCNLHGFNENYNSNEPVQIIEPQPSTSTQNVST